VSIPPSRTSAVFPLVGRLHFQSSSRQEVEFIVREIFEQKTYERHGITLKPGDTVFDVGANVGIFSLYANAACAGRCAIFAFEPIPSTFRFLELNLAQHDLLARPGIHALNLGLTSVGGPKTATMTIYRGFPGNATLYPEDKETELRKLKESLLHRFAQSGGFEGKKISTHVDFMFEEEQVRCEFTTLSAVCRDAGVRCIDLLKNDTEGSELDVLESIDDAVWPRIRQIVTETATVERASIIKALLMSKGYTIVEEQEPVASAVGLDNRCLYARRESG
jgi:FkbM family methyltransferase